MTMSCNGCRVLRKGCSDDCSIRPCLLWIKSPESQGHATLFLAKFYGRAGLLNLVNAGPDHLRPAIFRSLLYEACGRIVNPTYGSVGLISSGRWQLCQAAVDAVLKGAPIMQISFENPAADSPLPPLHKASYYDIRHIAKGPANPLSLDLHKVNINASRTPFKRVGCHANGIPASLTKPNRTSLGSTHDGDLAVGPNDARVRDSFQWCFPIRFQREPSHDSSTTQGPQPSSAGAAGADPGEANPGDGGENESVFSEETVEMSMMTTHGMEPRKTGDDRVSEENDVHLELTLGFESPHAHHSHSPHGSGSSHGHRHNPSRSDPRAGQCFRLPIGGAGLAAGRIQTST